MVQKHFIEVENTEGVAAVHHSADSNRWIFFCHGFGGGKGGNTSRRARKAPERGYNGVAFDFRGNGESDGDFIEQDLSSRISDLKAVIDYFDPESCALFGSSFGGKVVFHAALGDDRVKAVVGKAPVTYNGIMDKFRAVVENKGEFEYIENKPIDSRFFDDFDRYPFEDVIEGLDIPVAVFHGSADTTVKPENSYRALEELDTDVSLHKLKGEKHSFSHSAEQKMMGSMVAFLDSIEF